MADDEDLPLPFEIGLLVTGDIEPVFDKAQARSAGFTFYVRNPPELLRSELQLKVDTHLQYVSLLAIDTNRQIRSNDTARDQEIPAEPEPLSRQQRSLLNGTKSVHGTGFRSVSCVGSCEGVVEENENLYSNTDSRQWAYLGFVGKEDEFKLAESSMQFIRTQRGSVCAIVPFSVKDASEKNGRSGISTAEEDYAITYFQNLMKATSYAKRIYAALDIRSLPEDHLERLNHWLSEPVDCIIIPTSVFVKADKTGVYIIHPFYRTVIEKIILLNRSSVLMCAKKQDFLEGILPQFVQTLKLIYETRLPADRCRRIDNLSFTMQPLRNNLTEKEYKGFQTDDVKYQQYGDAMAAAMLDLRRKRSAVVSGNWTKFTVAVLGCGGGPLVERAIHAAKTIGAEARVYAVDKNPESIAMVRERCKTEWRNDDVIIQHADIRKWNSPELLDFVVHELLGNFADDECCPECLENAPELLKEDGLSIPSRYTNFLTPISSTRLYGELKSGGKKRLFQQVQCFEADKVAFLSLSHAKAVITFCHGPSETVTSERSVRVDFEAKTAGLLHGFAGHFKADLSGDVKLVTGLTPSDRTKDLHSWSLLYFPIPQPVRVRKGEQISLHFRRRRGPEAVWYEWQLFEPSELKLQNANGEWQRFSLVFEDSVGNDMIKDGLKKGAAG